MTKHFLFFVIFILYLKPVHSTDGGWSEWSGYSGCGSGQCSGNVKIRTRTCTNPVPSDKGKYCEGVHSQNISCPVAGGWTEWGQWSVCDQICGGAIVNRTRRCANPKPRGGGAHCQGKSLETKLECAWACEKKPIDGDWGPWSHWSKCPKPCGLSPGILIERKRRCDSPPPQNGGKNCKGNATESVLSCFDPCPVDGKYDEWSPWTPCSKTCNTGNKRRERTCDKPFPDHGGKPCQGLPSEEVSCKLKDCPGSVSGGWSNWGGWTKCTEKTLCFAGNKTRSRTCTNPAPQGEGDDCQGTGKEVESCPSPQENCRDSKVTLSDQTDADPNSFIFLECGSAKKYSVTGSFASQIPDKIFTEYYKSIGDILKSGYFAKKDEEDKQTKYCFEPQDTLTVKEMTAIFGSYKHTSTLPTLVKPPMTNNVPGLSITLDESLVSKKTEFQCHSCNDFTPATGYTLYNVRFTFYSEGAKASFQAKGDLRRVKGVSIKSVVTQITGALEASGSTEESITLSQLLDLGGIPTYQIPMPVQVALKAVGLLNIKMPAVSYSYSTALLTFRFTSTIKDIGLNVEVITNPNKGKRLFAVGFSYTSASFGELSKKLTGINIDFFNIFGTELQLGLSYVPSKLGDIKVTKATTYSKEPLHSFTSAGATLPKDLFIGAKLVLPKDCKGNGFCTGCKDLLGPDANFFLTGNIQEKSVKVTAGIGNVKLNDDITLNKVLLYVEANFNGSQTSYKFGFQVEVKIPVNKGEVVRDGVKIPAPAINVGGKIEYDTLKNTIGGSLYMKGMWRKAFGVKWLALGNIVLGIKWAIGSPTPTGGYFGAAIEIGENCWSDADFTLDGHCFRAKGYFGLGEPSFVYVELSAITIGKIFRLANSNTKLPPPIEESGFPKGVMFSYATDAIDLVYAGGPNIAKGIKFDGTINILGYEIAAKVIISEGYVLADIKLDPINWNGLLEMYRSPSKKSLGPMFFVEWKKDPFFINARFEGYVNLLGISIYANMNLTMTEFQLLIHGDFLGLLTCRVYVAASYAPVFSKLKFYAKVTVDLSGFNKVLEEAAQAVNKAFESAKAELRGAQEHVKRKKAECKRKMSLKCENCRNMKCKKAENDCKGFLDKAGKWIGGAARKVGNFFKKIFSWKRKRGIIRNEMFEQHIRRRRFIDKIICEGIVGGGCNAVAYLCEGSCRAVEFIGKGLCNILDIAVGILKLAEMTCGWINSVIKFVLLDLFRIHSIEFEFGIDNSVGGRIKFAAGVDFTIFGKRLYLGINIDLKNPIAAIKGSKDKGLDKYKSKANQKRKTGVSTEVYDEPNPFSDYDFADKFLIENTQSASEDEARKGACLYSPSKSNGELLRLTACREDDEQQLFYYSSKGLLMSSYSKLCVDSGGSSIGSKLRQVNCDERTDNQRFECDLEVRTIKRRRTTKCWTAGKTSVNGPGSLVQVSSSKCINEDGGVLKISKKCNQPSTEFKLDSNGYLKHTRTGKCVVPRSRVVNGVGLQLGSCSSANRFGFTKGGSLKHLASNRCIQPKQEVDKPGDGNSLVLRDKCENNYVHRQRLIFTFVPTDSYIHMHYCTFFEQALLSQRFEVMDDSLAVVCSKYDENVAFNKPTAQSSVSENGFAKRAVDGNLNTVYRHKSCTMTKSEANPWWRVDLLSELIVTDVTILNRATHGDRLDEFEVRVGNNPDNYRENPTCFERFGKAADNEVVRVQCIPPLPGRYVRVQMFGTGILSMCEVMVYARYAGSANLCLLDNGGCDQICHNKCGRKVECACGVGYKLSSDGKTCLDKDECLVNNGGCQQVCFNIPGGRVCDCFNSGYVLKENSETECEDYNECGNANAGCEQICKNTVGAYTCDCRAGFKLRDNKHSCEDIDECRTKNGGCAHKCNNYKGGYWCSCNAGYRLMSDLHGCEEKLCPPLIAPFRSEISPSSCGNKRARVRRNTKCSYSCPVGYRLAAGSTSRTCTINGTFDGKTPYCRPLYCPKVKAPLNGDVFPASCATNPSGSEFGQRCVFYCKDGYELRGPRFKTCQADQTWSEAMQSTCVRVFKKPWIVCPNYLEISLPSNKNKIALGEQWRLPNTNMKQVSVKQQDLNEKYEFSVGVHPITWIATSEEGSTISCTYHVKIKDITPPVVSYCPKDQTISHVQAADHVVHWKEPVFTDNDRIATIVKTAKSGSLFKSDETTTVRYMAFDASSLSATCSFKITIKRKGYTDCSRIFKPLHGSTGDSLDNFLMLTCDPGFEPPPNFGSSMFNSFICTGNKWCSSYPDVCHETPLDCLHRMSSPCKPGYAAIPGQNYCLSCGSGTYHNTSLDSCEQCSLNYYSDQLGMLSCQACPRGSRTTAKGASSISQCLAQCQPGTFSNDGLHDPKKSPCKKCPVNTYQRSTGAAHCSPCPEGTSTIAEGSTSKLNCTAPAKIIETVPNSKATAYVGEQITLECLLSGSPEPKITLDRVGASLPTSDRVTRVPLYSVDEDVIGIELTILRVTASDGGQYKCKVENSRGVDEKILTLEVKNTTKKRTTDQS